MNINPRFRQFYQDWKQKADEYSEEELRDVFDKFITLFVLYNFEYNEIVQILKSDGTHIYNRNEKAKGILEVIYYVRCNLFHGHKQYMEYQRELLLPLSKILNVVVEICFVKITN